MTIAEIKEKIKTNTKIPAELKEKLNAKIPYLPMEKLQKLASLLMWQEDQNAITDKVARAFLSMNNYATKKATKSVSTLRENKSIAQDEKAQEDLIKQLDNL